MSDFGRIEVDLLELDIDTCTNEYGASPCTAGTEIRSSTTQSGSTTSSIVLDASASAVDDFYNGDALTLPSDGGERRVITDYDGTSKAATVSPAFSTAPGSGVTFRVIEADGECYNTFRTCQDTANFTKGTKTLKFCSRGAPIPLGEEIRPQIRSVRSSATEVDLEDGLARRGGARITLEDETAPDVGQDPYIATRSSVASGSFWRRLLARNHNTSGRTARLRRAFFDGDWDDTEFVDELYIIDAIDGPDDNGRVTANIKDVIKLTDRRKIPEPSEGRLDADITSSALSLTLEAGQGADYEATGYVTVDREIIQYTGKSTDTLSWPDTDHRGTFGTTAADHSAMAAVQQARVWVDEAFTDVLEDILLESDVPSGNIDSAGFATEDTDWLGTTYRVTAAIPKPEDASRLLGDLCKQVRGYMWWSPTEQKVKFKVLAPPIPTTTVPLLTDAASVVEESIKISRLDKLRTTVRSMFYGLRSATENRREASNYGLAAIYFDTTAESANEYGDRRNFEAFNRWWDENNSVAALSEVIRAALYYRDAPIDIDLWLAVKDADIVESDIVDLETALLTDFAGLPSRERLVVTRREQRNGQIRLRCRTTGFSARVGFIGGSGDYPTNDEYAHIAADANGFSDGTDPYVIF